MTTDFSKLDFFHHKILAGKDAKFYVRDGRSFMYVAQDRYDFDNPSKDDLGMQIGHIEASPINVNKNIALNGFIWLWQNEEYYALVFFDDSRSHPPIALKFGNALLES